MEGGGEGGGGESRSVTKSRQIAIDKKKMNARLY